MIILAIDTSCDETSVAVTDGTRVLSNAISSQIRYHKKYGGVVPFLAQRMHEARIDAVVEQGLVRSGLAWKDVEAIAVTYGPGLAPALQVGIAKAKGLSTRYGLPLYAINHMAGHIASCFAGGKPVAFPALAVLVSGKHTDLVRMERFGSFELIGETLDDALGEAYDKTGRLLGLGYPGGKVLAKLAEEGDPRAYELPIPMLRSGDLNFSYSGLKNAVRLLALKVKNGEERPFSRKELVDICASFQYVSQASLLIKLEKALDMHPEVRTILMAGGVAANKALRVKVRALASKWDIATRFPANAKLCTDNAAMIGVAAYLQMEAGLQPVADLSGLDRVPNLRLEKAAD